MPGLGEDWWRVIRALRGVSDFYRSLNSAISLGMDRSLRREAVKGEVDSGPILDAGAGDGSLTETILEENPGADRVVMLDFLEDMLRRSRLDSVDRVIGVFENLPFREDAFKVLTTSFALRDSRDMIKTINEFSRVLRSDGKYIILDLGKPRNPLARLLYGFYWRVLAPMIAVMRLGVKGRLAAEIYPTYRKLPTNKDLEEILSRFFTHVELREKFLGGVIIVRAFNPIKSP